LIPLDKLRFSSLGDMVSVEETKAKSLSVNNGAASTRDLTRGSLLARNTIWNLLGQLVPIVVGVLVIPKLIRGLGTDRFGVLSIAWMIVGYFSVFDLGIGRALTALIAYKLGMEEYEDLSAVVWTANLLMLLLGVCSVFTVYAVAPVLTHKFLRVSLNLQPEIVTSFRILSLSIPFVILTAGFRGVLEAKQHFGVINAVRIPLGALTFLGPLIVLSFSVSLVPSVAVLTLIRGVICGIYLVLALRAMPVLRRDVQLQLRLIPKLLRFGGWMTVTNVVGPVMVNMDRLLVGSLVSVAAVAYYATPYEIVSKLSILPFGLAAVLFPAFSFSSTANDHNKIARLLDRSLTHVMLLLFLPSLIIVTFAHTGMRFWLGQAFASHSSFVLQLLCIGVFANGIGQVPFALVQGMARPDLTAKLHIAELLVYLPGVWWLTASYGIRGTALAWVVRAVVDAVLLLAASVHVLPTAISVVRHTYLRMALALAFLTVGVFTTGLSSTIFAVLTTLLFLGTSWFFLLTHGERIFIGRFARIV